MCDIVENGVEVDTIDYTAPFIEHNVFYREVSSEDAKACAYWVLENEDKVKSRIRNTFANMGHSGADVDDCYSYILGYFLEYEDAAFNEDYFYEQIMYKLENEHLTADELKKMTELLINMENREYKMEYYILNRSKTWAMGFVRKLNQQRELLRFEEYDDAGDRNRNVVSIDVATANKVETDVNRSIPEITLIFEDLDDIYENELDIYNEEFREKGLDGFDMKLFVRALFLEGLESLEESAEYMGISIHLLNNYISGFRKIVEDEYHDGGEYGDLRDNLEQLVEGARLGWSPGELKVDVEDIA